MKPAKPNEGLTTPRTLHERIEIQPTDPEKGGPRIQASVGPDGVDLFVDTGDTGTIAIWMSTDAWQKLVTLYVQRNGEPWTGRPEGAWQPVEPSLLPREHSSFAVERSALRKYLEGTMCGTADLDYLLYILNTRSTSQHRMVRGLFDSINLQEMKPTVMELFQLHSSNALTLDTMEFAIYLGDKKFSINIPAYTPIGAAIFRAFTSRDRWRLKRCIECEKYFFDATMNGKQQHCTPRCKSRHTSRTYYSRRRAAQASPPS